MRITIDFETRSACDLLKCGSWVYAEHPTTEVMCCAVKVDGYPPSIWLPDPFLAKLPGDVGLPLLPTSALYDLITQASEIECHNAGFETSMWELTCARKYAWPALPHDKLRCSMAKAAFHNLPQKLEQLCQALELPIKKDMVGNALMRKMCKPRKVLKKERLKLEAEGCVIHGKEEAHRIDRPDGTSYYLWHETPADIIRLCEYCLQDVEAEYAASNALPDMPGVEIKIWQLDQRVNRRGCKVDIKAVKAFLEEVDRRSLGSHDVVTDLTDGAAQTVKQVAKCLAWMRGHGVEMPNLAQDTVKEFLERKDLPQVVRDFLVLRQQFGKASTSKYPPILLGASADERFRGAFVYHGAGTGRFCLAGSALIPVKDVSGSVRVTPIWGVSLTDKVWDGDAWVTHEGVVCAGLKRVIEYDGIEATPEHEVYVSDTEKMHLADARDAGIELFQGGLPPGLAGDMVPFGPPASVAITYDIVNAGPRNRFMANGRIVSNSSRRAQLHNLPRGKFSDAAMCIEMVLEHGYDKWVEFLFGDFMAAASTCIRGMFIAEKGKQLYVGDFSSVEARFLAWLADEEKDLDAFRTGKDLYKVAASGIFSVPYEQINKPQRQLGKTAVLALGYQGGINAFATMAVNYSIDLEELPSFVLPVASDEVKERAEKSARLYMKENPDVMSLEAAMACDVIKQLWRADHQRVVALWAALEEAAILAVKNRGSVYTYRGIKYLSDGKFLRCKLPSGRCLHYYKPAVEFVIPRWVDQDAIKKKVREENPSMVGEPLAALVKARLQKHSKELVTFWGVSSKPGPTQGKFIKQAIYGGLLVENSVQAGCRDLLVYSLLNLENAGYSIVLHVHDEGVSEVPLDFGSLHEFEAIMAKAPAWAEGLPMGVEGFVTTRYRK